MEIAGRGDGIVQPSVRPFDPDGSKGLTPSWTMEPRSDVIVQTQSNETNKNQVPKEPEKLT
jgi:hypothetical protein